jgi:hypothetical protein
MGVHVTNQAVQPDPSKPYQKQVRLDVARWRLGIVWFGGAGLLTLLLVALAFSGVYGERQQELFGWAFPNFLPTVALMISVFAANAFEAPDAETTYVRKNFCTLSVGISIFYLLLLFIPLIAPVLTSDAPTPDVRLRNLENAGLFLGPIQALVVAVLGTLFFLREKEA